MGSFQRLVPYIWPYRRRLIASILLSLVIAALWGANLTVAFPVVKVLLERTNLHDYVEQTIAGAAAEEEKLVTRLATTDDRLASYETEGLPENDPAYVDLLGAQLHIQDKLARERRTLYQFRWIKLHVLPFVPRNEFQTLAWLLVLVLVATAVKGVLIFFQEVLVGSVAELSVMGVRKELLQRVLKLDYESLSREGTHGLMSRFTYDAEQLSQGITLLGGKLIREPLKCLSCMIFALAVNWRLTLLSLIFIPLLGLFLGKMGRMLKRASRRMMESMSQIYKALEETFAGLKVVIAFNSSEHHRQQFDRQYETYFRKAMRVVKIDAAAKPSLELLGLMAMFVALIPGAYLVLRGKTHIGGLRLTSDVMSPAELSMLYALLAGMLDPCRKLSTAFSRIKRSSAAIDRIFALADQESTIADPADLRPMPRHSKSIEFRDVCFRYVSRDEQMQRGLALEHLDLKVHFGEVVAIVGQNGCGKSTLVNLLPRFYDPQSGEVLIDGRSLKEVPLANLRGQVGIVTQETVLFDETIFENIRYGRPSATREEVEEAARQAHVLPIVETLPHGFETVIGDQGKDLSGGQRQRIALARVILRDPAILILDEATSAADAESEALIHQTLKTFVRDRTTFLITHSMTPGLLEVVTRIVVMENGKVVGSGSHDDLLHTCPLYDRLFNSSLHRAVNEEMVREDNQAA